MKIKLHRNFERRYKKLTAAEKKSFTNKRDLFLRDEFQPILNNHRLKGNYLGYRSINITGDIRVIYTKLGQVVVFVTIDSHSNLYG